MKSVHGVRPTHTSIEKSRSLRCTLSHQGYADPWFPISSPLLDGQQDEKRGQVKEDREHWPDEVREGRASISQDPPVTSCKGSLKLAVLQSLALFCASRTICRVTFRSPLRRVVIAVRHASYALRNSAGAIPRACPHSKLLEWCSLVVAGYIPRNDACTHTYTHHLVMQRCPANRLQ